jgi:hypothetical protein
MPNVLSTDKQIAIVSSLAEGSSIRSIERITGVHRDTIMRLGVPVGQAMLSKPAPKKIGRPKLSEDRAKAKIVPVRFTPDELERMTAAAAVNGVNLSQWIRSTLNSAL